MRRGGQPPLFPFLLPMSAFQWTTDGRKGGCDKLSRSLFVGFIRIHILYHASKEPVFGGMDMIKELARHGYQLGPGALYATLHRMERERLLRSEKAATDGRRRKYYRITEEGIQMLAQAYQKMGELTRELSA